MPKKAAPDTTPALGREAVEEIVRQKLPWLSSNKQAHEAVIAVLEGISEVMAANIDKDGFKLRLPLFGSYKVKHVTGKMTRNPKTGEKKMAEPKRKIRWVPSPNWKAMEVVTK